MRAFAGLHRPAYRRGDGGVYAPLPAAPDADQHAAADVNESRRGATLLLHHDASTGRTLLTGSRSIATAASCTHAHVEEVAPAPAAAPAKYEAGGVQRRLPRPAGVSQSRRCRSSATSIPAHAAAGRPGQGREDRHALAPTAQAAAQPGGRRTPLACCSPAGCFPATIQYAR